MPKILHYRQVVLLKRVADLPPGDVLRTCVLHVVYLAHREAADADAQGKVGLLKRTGLLQAGPIMTGVRLTVCGNFHFLNGSGGLRISVLVPDAGTCSCPCVTVHESFTHSLTHSRACSLRAQL